MEDKLSCVAQMIETHKRSQSNVIGPKTTPIEHVSRFGAIAGVLHRDDIMLKIPRAEIAEIAEDFHREARDDEEEAVGGEVGCLYS